MIKGARAGQGKHEAIGRGGSWEMAAELTDEQKKAVIHVLVSRDLVTAITGRAGTGKTTMAKEAVKAVQTLSLWLVSDRSRALKRCRRNPQGLGIPRSRYAGKLSGQGLLAGPREVKSSGSTAHLGDRSDKQAESAKTFHYLTCPCLRRGEVGTGRKRDRQMQRPSTLPCALMLSLPRERARRRR